MTDGSRPAPAHGEDLAVLFHRAGRLMARAHHRQDHAHHAQARVLSIIRQRGPMPQGELLHLLDVRSSSLSEVLGKLERQGLIVRERNEQDRRGFVVTATGRGHGPAPGREGDGARTDGPNLFACLDDQERAQLRTILLKLVAALQDDAACPAPAYARGGRGQGMGKVGPGPGMGRGGGKGGRGGGRGRGRG